MKRALQTSSVVLANLAIALMPISARAQVPVQWTKNAVVIDGNTAQNALTSVSADGHVLVFNTSDSRITNLAPGQVLVLQDLGARKVLGTVRQGPMTAVATNAAALVDFIQDGTIQFPNSSKDPSILDQQDTTSSIPGVDHLEGMVGDWKYQAKSETADSGPNDIKYSFKAEKHIGGLDAVINGNGKLTESGFSFMANIHDAKLTKLLFTAPIEGNLKVDWAVATSGANSGIGERRLRLPSFFKEIFVANHLPFLYEINANLIYIPGLGSKHEAVSGGFAVNYSGHGGFAATDKDSSPIKEMKASEKSMDKVTNSALAANGVVLAVNAPKLAFSFGTASFLEAVHSSKPAALKNGAVADGYEAQLAKFLTKDSAEFFRTEGGAYVQWVNEYDYAGSGPMSIVPNCSTTHFNLIASGGVDAKLFGINGKGSFDLFRSESSKTEPDVGGCRVDKK